MRAAIVALARGAFGWLMLPFQVLLCVFFGAWVGRDKDCE